MFPVTGTSLTDTVTDGGGGLLPAGKDDPRLILGGGRKSLAIFRNSKERKKKKNWKNQDPVKGPRWSRGPLLCSI